MRGTDMLLQEGMNVKVLLLPDGDDPDSFSRKHTAQQFKEYIEQHQTDFIQFKTELLLKGVSDPIKRAEAINNIVRSVSVIPDPIVRATYITECSRRLKVNERTLITQTNKFIAGDKEEQRKTAEREQQRQPLAAEPIENYGLHTLQEQASEVERLLMQNIIRHGEEIIFDGLETDDGGTVSLNVAQYVDYDLSSDNLSFSNDLYNTVLREAVEHSADPDFKASDYFLRHPDPAISQLAATLGIDSHQLSKSFMMKNSETTLRQRVQHLILDFRLDIVSKQLSAIQQQMKEAGADMEKLRPLMDNYKQMLQLRNALAQQRGSDVIA
jgi:DNA primase